MLRSPALRASFFLGSLTRKTGRCVPPPPIAASLLLSKENPRKFPVWKNIRTCVTPSLLQLQMAMWIFYVSLVALTKNNPSNPRFPISPSPSPPSRLCCTTETYKEALVRERQTDRDYRPTLTFIWKPVTWVSRYCHIRHPIHIFYDEYKVWRKSVNIDGVLMLRPISSPPLSCFRPQRSKEGASWRVCVEWSGDTLRRHNAENSKQIFPKKNCAATVPIPPFMFLWAIYIFPWSVCLFCCRTIYRWTERGNIKIAHRYMKVESGTEAAQFLFCGYINPNFFAVQGKENKRGECDRSYLHSPFTGMAGLDPVFNGHALLSYIHSYTLTSASPFLQLTYSNLGRFI